MDNNCDSMEGTYSEHDSAVKMAMKSRHSQRVKQKLEEKLENLKSLEDKLHSTIRNHVSKAEWKCHQMLNIDNTSEFMSQYGKAAQMLEAATNTIDLLTISAEELIENAGFDESAEFEAVPWSADHSLLSSTILQSESTLHISLKGDQPEMRADNSQIDNQMVKELSKSTSHLPASFNTLTELVASLNENVCSDTQTEHVPCTCDSLGKITERSEQCNSCINTGEQSSAISSRHEELDNSAQSKTSESCDSVKSGVPNVKTEDSRLISNVKTSVTAHVVPMCVKKSLSRLSEAETLVKKSDKTNTMDNTVKQSNCPKVQVSTPTKKKKSAKKGKGERTLSQSSSSDIALKCDNKNAEKFSKNKDQVSQNKDQVSQNEDKVSQNKDKESLNKDKLTKNDKDKLTRNRGTFGNDEYKESKKGDRLRTNEDQDSKKADQLDVSVDKAAVKQAEVKYSEFEEELCGELNRQDVNKTTLRTKKQQTKERVDALAEEINKEVDCLSSSTATNQTNSRNEANVAINSKSEDSLDLQSKPNNESNSDNHKSGPTTKDESNVTHTAGTSETSDKLSGATRGLTTGSLLSGKITPVVVSEIVSPWCFFVSRNGPQLSQMMENICEYMGLTGLKEAPLLDADIGAICLARYYRDGTYYRAYITQIYKSSDCHVSEVDVLYVDYGNRERVKVKDLRVLPHKFMMLPSQAICCALAGVMPCNKYCVWAEDDVNLFRQYVTGQNLNCVTSSIRTSAVNIPQVVQLSITYPIPSMKALPDGTYYMSQFSIAELMIQAKRARHVDLPEQLGLLVKSGEGTEEVAILGQNLETGSESSLHITEIVESKSDFVDTSGENVSGGKHKESVDAVKKKDDNKIQAESKKANHSIKEEPGVKTSVDMKHDSKTASMNGDCLKSETSETESQVAEKGADKEVVGSRGHLDRIKEEINEPQSVDAKSTGTSLSNDADFLMDQESSLVDLHYDITSLQFNPQGQEVMLSFVKTPKEFYVHIISQQCGEALDSLMKNLNSVFEKANRRKLARLSKSFELSVNKLCCAQFQEDNNFYRGVIRNTKSDKRTLDGYVLVHYIDFGDEEWLPRKRIFPLPSLFCKVPRLALKCNLVYIKPISDNGEPVKWSSQSIKIFTEIAGFEKTLHMHVMNGSLDDIKHCDPSTEMPSLGVLLVDYSGSEEVCINIDMINEGVATLDSTPAKGKLDQQPLKEGNEREGGMGTWNPMEEDFFSKRNSYNIDTDDVGVATTGYKADDEQNICRFFASGRTCWRGERCPYRHVQVHSGVTHDRDEVYAISDVHTEHLPVAGSWVAMEITTILSPSHFYAILPLGNKSLDKTVSKSDQSEGSCMGVTGNEETLDDLLAALSCEYSKRPSHQESMFMKAIGQMVVARYSTDQQWYRARVVAVSEEKVKVFFVDFGNTEWLSEDEIADIKPEFLHLPFQAIECFLNIECTGSDQWCNESKQEFRELVDGKTLIGLIKWRSWNGCLWLDLYDTTTDADINVGGVMVEKGYGKVIDVPSEKSMDTDNVMTSQSSEEVLIPG